MNKKLIRLTESDLHRIVRESVNKVLNEIGDTQRGQYHLGRATMRKIMNGDGEGAAEIGNHAISKGKKDGDWYPIPFRDGMKSQRDYMMSLKDDYDDERLTPDHYKGSIDMYDKHYKDKWLNYGY